MSAVQDPEVHLPSMPRSMSLRCHITEVSRHFDHPYVRLYEMRVERMGGFSLSGPNRSAPHTILVATEVTSGMHEIPRVGRSPHLLEMDYRSEEGIPRFKAVTVKSVAEWLAAPGASRATLRNLKGELPAAIAYAIEDVLCQEIRQTAA